MGVDSSSPLLTKELSPRHIDLAAEVFQILKDARGRPLSVDEVNVKVKRLGRESLNAYSDDDIEQALQDPVLVGLAKKLDTRRYQITDPAQKVTKADVIYHMLERPYNENKGPVESFLDKRRNERRIVFFGLAFLMVLFLLLFWWFLVNLVYPLAATIARTVAIGLVIVFFALLAVSYYSNTRTWSMYHLSVERALAVRLLDAYSGYRPFIADKETDSLAKTEQTVQRVALSLEELKSEARTAELTDWDTIRCESERASKIGQELRTRVIPSIGKEEHSEKIGEILVGLARLLFEGSPDSMKQATELFKDPRFKDLPAEKLPVSAPKWMHMKQTARRSEFRILIAIAVAAGVLLVVVLAGTALTGAKFEPNPMNLVGCLAAFGTVAAFVIVALPGKTPA